MPTNTRLNGLDEYGQPLLSEQLEANLFQFFNWGLLEVGAFFNVTIPSSGAFGGNMERLRLSTDPAYTAGQVWEGFRKDWVWETGLEYHRQPIRVSGVYVNNTFQPSTGVGAFSHVVDYRNGRIVFNSAISTSSTVKCEYSYRLVHFETSEGVAKFRKDLQTNSFRVDDSHFLQIGSGEWNTSPAQRIQLPAVIVEAQPQVRRTPRELGSLQQHVKQEVTFHLFAELDSDYLKIHDIITYQEEKTIIGFDKREAVRQGRLGLDYQGSPLVSGLMYPDLVKPLAYGGFAWKKITFERVNSNGALFTEHPLFYAPIKATIDVIYP